MNSPPFSPGISSSLQNGLRGAQVLAWSQLIGRGDTRAMVELYWNAFSPGKQVNKQVIIVSFLKSSKWETNPIYKPVLPAQLPQFEWTMATAFLINLVCPSVIRIILSLVAEETIGHFVAKSSGALNYTLLQRTKPVPAPFHSSSLPRSLAATPSDESICRARFYTGHQALGKKIRTAFYKITMSLFMFLSPSRTLPSDLHWWISFGYSKALPNTISLGRLDAQCLAMIV